MSISGAPRSISTTPGCSTAPETVTRDVPGSSSRPWDLNASGPMRAIIATCASVSALCTSAPFRPMRRVVPLSGRKKGSDSPVSTQLASADSSPAMKRSGGRTMDFGNGRVAGGRALVQRACHRRGDLMPPFRHTDDHPVCADGGGQELGAVEHQVRRTNEQKLVLVAGRLALHAIDEDGAARPSGVGDRELDSGREAGPAPAGQAGGLEHGDEGVTPTMARRSGQRDGTQGGDVTGQVGRIAEQSVAARGPQRLAGARHAGLLPAAGAVSARCFGGTPATAECVVLAEVWREARRSRQANATPTARTHTTPSTMTQVSPASVPMPNVWASATGQLR